jgi:hypothetical protein
METKTKELIEEILKNEIEEMPEIKNAFLTSSVNHRTLLSLEKLAELHKTLTEQGDRYDNRYNIFKHTVCMWYRFINIRGFQMIDFIILIGVFILLTTVAIVWWQHIK